MGDPANDWLVRVDFDGAGCAIVEATRQVEGSGSEFRSNLCKDN